MVPTILEPSKYGSGMVGLVALAVSTSGDYKAGEIFGVALIVIIVVGLIVIFEQRGSGR